ncbi:MAG TPA: hypothetical protein VL490_05065, partial [Mucilaginibacter sp.]|nr:hypothetical protein [Mucilaginibacter sp.]
FFTLSSLPEVVLLVVIRRQLLLTANSQLQAPPSVRSLHDFLFPKRTLLLASRVGFLFGYHV